MNLNQTHDQGRNIMQSSVIVDSQVNQLKAKEIL